MPVSSATAVRVFLFVQIWINNHQKVLAEQINFLYRHSATAKGTLVDTKTVHFTDAEVTEYRSFTGLDANKFYYTRARRKSGMSRRLLLRWRSTRTCKSLMRLFSVLSSTGLRFPMLTRNPERGKSPSSITSSVLLISRGQSKTPVPQVKKSKERHSR